MRVLIVDDSLMMRMEMKVVMESLGHEVVYMAKDGEEAINKYTETSPDFVTMDITMPNMNGIQALKHIIDDDSNAKVLMVTSSGLENLVIEAINLGAVGYILKPATVDTMKESIHKIFSGDDNYNMESIFKDV